MHKAWQPKKQELKHFTTWETQKDNSFFLLEFDMVEIQKLSIYSI